MTAFYSHPVKTVVSLLLLTAIFTIGILGFVSMSHGMNQCPSCPVGIAQPSDCQIPSGINLCYEIHLGMINSLSRSQPANFAFILLILLFIVQLFSRRHFNRLDTDKYFIKVRLRLRQLTISASHSWQKQIGQWLSLRERKNDAAADVGAGG